MYCYRRLAQLRQVLTQVLKTTFISSILLGVLLNATPSAAKTRIEWGDLKPNSAIKRDHEKPSVGNVPSAGAQAIPPLPDLGRFSNDINHWISPNDKDSTGSDPVNTWQGQRISIPGFIVPLPPSKDAQTRQFFLVPNFGALITSDTPDANQIILVEIPEPIDLGPIYRPYLITGIIVVDQREIAGTRSHYRIAAETVDTFQPASVKR